MPRIAVSPDARWFGWYTRRTRATQDYSSDTRIRNYRTSGDFLAKVLDFADKTLRGRGQRGLRLSHLLRLVEGGAQICTDKEGRKQRVLEATG